MPNSYWDRYKGKTVGFVGLGISNRPVFDRLVQYGVRCVVRDRKPLTDSFAPCVKLVTGEHYLDGIDEDVLFLSPAVRPDIPALLDASKRGVSVTSEMQEFFSNSPCHIIGVTGSDGKTTTTTLIGKLLEASGASVRLGGNIGINLLAEIDDIRPDEYAVVELSSFQLFKMTRSPDIAVITNLAPNHLDWHRGMQEYADAKANILRFQKAAGVAVLNADDPYTERYASESKGSVRLFSGCRKLEDGVWFDQEGIYRGDKKILCDSDILAVGRHNRYNYCAAIAALGDLVSEENIKSVATSFRGVEHRIEFVREWNGIRFFNSSIDSSPSRTRACLSSFSDKVIVICGGYDKQIPLDSLGPLFLEKVKHAFVCGATAEKLEAVFSASGFQSYEVKPTFDEAVSSAAARAEPGDCVVLSPAAASFDQFKNFEERGNRFKQLIMNLK
ncbi:MAG: UDP-N-acetylmuramoyl-L-alanine--D-glutamate ligase [Clostridia bacterium]|nr:UDP-N-acetylmuramoyl-L-alanine--D-glutamate ligase [Clostridia bacterium]